MYSRKYYNAPESFRDFIQKFKDGKLEIPKGRNLIVSIDNDSVRALIDSVQNEDGEEIEDPIYLYNWGPLEALKEALILLGLEADFV